MASPLENTPPPAASRRLQLKVPGAGLVGAVDDPYSDRLRCDHPGEIDGEALAARLEREAAAQGRGRVVALVPAALEEGMAAAGFETEALIPGFYRGADDCAVMGRYLEEARGDLANPREVAKVQALVEAPRAAAPPVEAQTQRARPEDAPAIAALLGEIFDDYPTPSDDPAYVEAQIRDGIPFRLVRDRGEVVACASADLVPAAQTAELTDCATRPSHRGQGLMQALLSDLMDDLRALSYPTAFTLARARIPGVNLAFQRLGFALHGTMPRSCRIGEGVEDMNVWSRSLAV